MLEKAAQELFWSKSHDSCLAGTGVVLPAENYGGITDGEQAVVGDGNAMSVAGQIVKDVFGSTEGWFGIDDPLLLIESAQEKSEVFFVGQWQALAIEHQLVVAKGAPQSSQELATKNAAEDFDR